MKRRGIFAGILLFLVAISLVPLSLFVREDREFSENENRYLAQRPQCSPEEILSGEFMQGMERYVNDQFPGRDHWITLKTGLIQLMGGREVNGVYLGEESYLIERWLPQEFDREQLMSNLSYLNVFLRATRIGRRPCCWFRPRRR